MLTALKLFSCLCDIIPHTQNVCNELYRLLSYARAPIVMCSVLQRSSCSWLCAQKFLYLTVMLVWVFRYKRYLKTAMAANLSTEKFVEVPAFIKPELCNTKLSCFVLFLFGLVCFALEISPQRATFSVLVCGCVNLFREWFQTLVWCVSVAFYSEFKMTGFLIGTEHWCVIQKLCKCFSILWLVLPSRT